MNKYLKHIISITISVFFCFISNAQNKSVNDVMWEAYCDPHINTKEVYRLLDSIDNLNRKEEINYIIYYKLKGLVDENDNNYIKAYESFNRGLEHANSIKEYAIAGDFNVYIADLLFKIKAYDKADKYYQIAEEIFKKEKDSTSLLDLYQGEAYNYYYKDQYQKSIDKILSNYSQFINSNHPMIVLNTNYMLHTNYLAIDDKVNADLYFKKYKDFLNNVDKYDPTYYPKNSYQYNLELMHISLIKYFTSKKEIDSAQFYINKLDIENMTYDILISSDYYQLMTDFYEVKGDKEMYYAYKDSLVFTLEEMSKKNIVDNVDLNERINSFKVLLNKEDQKKNWFYIVCITLILSIIIIIYFIRRNLIIVKQKKIKEEQIVTLSNQVTNQNKINLKIKESENFINEIKSELKNITRMSESSDRKMKIHDLFIKIHHKSNTEKFEGSYEQLYLFSPSFFNNLKKEYPSLNKSELIVCFYINLNLKNSEISSLLDKSIRSIESTRYRIRKKLDLNNSNFNIKDTLSSL